MCIKNKEEEKEIKKKYMYNDLSLYIKYIYIKV